MNGRKYNPRRKLRAAWYNMLARNAGVGKGRGRAVCDEWTSFEPFAKTLGLPPSASHVLCMRNPELGFRPGNVYWGTRRELQQYVEHAKVLHYRGRSLSISGWAAELGILPETIRNRLETGLPLSRVLSSGRCATRRPRSLRPHSSRFFGVSYRSKDAAWEAKLRVHGQLYYLGIYHHEREAAEAVRKGQGLIAKARRGVAPSRIREALKQQVVKTMRPDRRSALVQIEVEGDRS